MQTFFLLSQQWINERTKTFEKKRWFLELYCEIIHSISNNSKQVYAHKYPWVIIIYVKLNFNYPMYDSKQRTKCNTIWFNNTRNAL